TTRGRLYQMRPSRFAMRFTDPKGDRIVADGRFLWLYTPSTTPGQVLRSRIPEYGSTGPNLIGQFVEHPRERYTARYVRVDSLAEGVADVVVLVPKTGDQPYSEATIWVSRDDALVRRLDIVEASGQRRTVMLREIRVNGGDLLDRENLAVEGRSASPAITPCHGCLGRCVESAAVSNGGMLRPRNRGIVSGLPGTGVAFSSPRISLFTA